MSPGDTTVSQPAGDLQSERTVSLKDPVLAAFLAWLVPGLGHLYQERTAKAILYFVCIMGTFTYGCYLGGSTKIGWARVVYFQWDQEDKRLALLCQAGIGLPVLPAMVQAYRGGEGREPLWRGFMAPPRSGPSWQFEGQPERATLNDLNFHLRAFFELGTVFTMIAGLLNVLAIYDAFAGPVFPEEKKAEEEQEADLEAEDAAAAAMPS
jgi:hypothetical protein